MTAQNKLCPWAGFHSALSQSVEFLCEFLLPFAHNLFPRSRPLTPVHFDSGSLMFGFGMPLAARAVMYFTGYRGAVKLL